MREIKFRAWDEKRKHYLGNWEYVINPDNGEVNELVSYNPECEKFRLNQEAVLEQFTGLQDKNGKEIYEGDVVALTDSSYMDENIQYERVYYNEKSEWVAGKVYLSKVYFNVEVVGNIHENMELLDEKV